MGPDALGLRGHFQGSLDGAWGDLTSACAEGPSVAIDHLRWEAPQRAISHGGLGYEPNRHQANRKECAMKLTSAQVERTLTQFEGQVIPDNHPVLPQLKSLFGEHTFFLDSDGLSIVEPAEAAGRGVPWTRGGRLADCGGVDPKRTA